MLHSDNEVIVIEIDSSDIGSSPIKGKNCYNKYYKKHYMLNVMEKYRASLVKASVQILRYQALGMSWSYIFNGLFLFLQNLEDYPTLHISTQLVTLIVYSIEKRSIGVLKSLRSMLWRQFRGTSFLKGSIIFRTKVRGLNSFSDNNRKRSIPVAFHWENPRLKKKKWQLILLICFGHSFF